MEQGSWIVADSVQAARLLNRVLEREKFKAQVVLEAPSILSFREFCRDLFRAQKYGEDSEMPALISQAQAQALMLETLAELGLGRDRRLATTILRARQQLCEFDVDRESLSEFGHWTGDTFEHMDRMSQDERFLRVISVYERTLADREYIDDALLPNNLLSDDRLLIKSLPAHTIVLHEGKPTPQRRRFVDHCQKLGSNIQLVDLFTIRADNEECPEELTEKREIRVAPTQTDELIAAAQFAKEQVERDASASVLIGVPDETEIKDQSLHIFSNVLGNYGEHHFAYAQGDSLYEELVVRDALTLITLCRGSVAYPELRAAMHCVHTLVGDDESIAWFAIERWIKSRGLTRCSIRFLLRIISESKELGPTPRLKTALQYVLGAIEDGPDRRTFGEWTGCFLNLLDHLGWPGKACI